MLNTVERIMTASRLGVWLIGAKLKTAYIWPFESELNKTRSINPLDFKRSNLAAESGSIRSNPNPS